MLHLCQVDNRTRKGIATLRWDETSAYGCEGVPSSQSAAVVSWCSRRRCRRTAIDETVCVSPTPPLRKGSQLGQRGIQRHRTLPCRISICSELDSPETHPDYHFQLPSLAALSSGRPVPEHHFFQPPSLAAYSHGENLVCSRHCLTRVQTRKHLRCPPHMTAGLVA
jgi:hypothetical protein